MPDLYLQFAGSLAAVALLVIGVHGLGFAREARLASEKEAREIAGHAPGGFVPVAIALDREGRGALLRDLGGRTVLLAPHGAHFIVEDLGEGAIAHLDGSRLAVTYGTATKARVTLDLGDDARDWAALVPALD
jgi:hypothetical protein